MKKIIKYVIIDILRNRIMLAYTLFLFLIGSSIFSLEDNSAKGLMSLLNIVLIIVPLVSLLFSAIYVYNSAEFLELLVSQPLRRRTIWLSLFIGLAGSMAVSFFAGIGIPILLFEPSATGFMMLGAGLFLSVIFVAIAMLAAVITRDKAKGIGVSILLWLYFSVLFQFADYPLEKPMIGMTALNPIDLSRVLVLLKMDVSVMMGYTGAIFKDFFGTRTGLIISFLVLVVWIIIPAWLSLRRFNRKDL